MAIVTKGHDGERGTQQKDGGNPHSRPAGGGARGMCDDFTGNGT